MSNQSMFWTLAVVTFGGHGQGAQVSVHPTYDDAIESLRTNFDPEGDYKDLSPDALVERLAVECDVRAALDPHDVSAVVELPTFPMRVHTTTVFHRHGQESWSARDPQAVRKHLVNYVRENWIVENFDESMPTDDDRVVDRYFQLMQDTESYDEQTMVIK